MAKVQVEVSQQAVQSIQKSPEMQADLKRRADAIAKSADSQTSPNPSSMRNENYVSFVTVGDISAKGRVVASNPHSMRDNARNNTLLKSMDAGR